MHSPNVGVFCGCLLLDRSDSSAFKEWAAKFDEMDRRLIREPSEVTSFPFAALCSSEKPNLVSSSAVYLLCREAHQIASDSYATKVRRTMLLSSVVINTQCALHEDVVASRKATVSCVLGWTACDHGERFQALVRALAAKS